MPLNANYSFLAKTSAWMAVANVSFFGLITWLLWKDAQVVPLWGEKSIASHLLVLSFAAGFIFCFLCTRSTQDALRHRKIMPLRWHLKSKTMIDQLPAEKAFRAFVVSLMGCFLAALVLFLFHLSGTEQLLASEFILFNMIYAAHFAAGAASISVYRAMTDLPVLKQREMKQG